jgi:hypothetical protein
MIELKQFASWPGVLAVESARYVCSHGIAPGRWIMTTYPQAVAKPVPGIPPSVSTGGLLIHPGTPDTPGGPEEYGDLTFWDGVSPEVVIRDCKLISLTAELTGDGGQTYILEGVDRRWKWEDKGEKLRGHYNYTDRRGKLVPWSIRSPSELARLCLDAMGERNALIQLPNGLEKAVGNDLDRFLKLGENFPQTLTNPEVIWDYTPPAQALANLVEPYGCRIVYQPIRDRVIIVLLGKGEPLPNGPYEVISPSVRVPGVPRSVNVAGSPVRIQARFLLEAVAEEWDGSFVPINEVSYAPAASGQPQISQIRNLGPNGANLGITLSFIDPATGAMLAFDKIDTNPAHTPAQKYADLIAKFMAEPEVAANFTITQTSPVLLTFKGKTNGMAFELGAYTLGDDCFYVAELVQKAESPFNSWQSCPPPHFLGVQATDRLSVYEAQALAQRSVWKCFRIRSVDPNTGKPPLSLPWFGKVKRRQQIILQDKKVALIVPSPRIPGAVNKGNVVGAINPNAPGNGVLPEFYNGYAREQKATVVGSISRMIGGQVTWFPSTVNALGLNFSSSNPNTAANDRVWVDFSIDDLEQLVVFQDYVYRLELATGGNGFIREPRLTLETGCVVMDEETNQVVRWEETLELGGSAPPQWSVRDDIKVSVIGKYPELSAASPVAFGINLLLGISNQLQGKGGIDFDYAELQEGKARAGHYLRGMAVPFLSSGGDIRRYPGIWSIDPDGYVQQVTWQIGGGATTIASGNCEHTPYLPPWPARRRAENLTPDESARLANQRERDFIRSILPGKNGGK